MIDNKNIPYYIFSSLIFIVLKFAYKFSDPSHLYFLLSPTNFFLELSTGVPTVLLPDGRFYCAELNFVIDKSCAGFNFWLLCSIMLTWLTLSYSKTHYQKTAALFLSFLGGLLITIMVNSSRILAAIIIQKADYSFLSNHHGIVHESIGIITNISFLILTYLIVEKVFTKINHHAKFA